MVASTAILLLLAMRIEHSTDPVLDFIQQSGIGIKQETVIGEVVVFGPAHNSKSRIVAQQNFVGNSQIVAECGGNS